MKFFYRCTRSFAKVFFSIFYKHQTFGLENLVAGKALLASNHASFFDPPLIAASYPEEVAFLARKTLFASPIFSFLISNLNAYPLSGTVQDLSSFKLISRLLLEEKKVLIFPEGSRTSDNELGGIKSGIGMLAMRSQAPIIPIYLHGTFDIWNRQKRLPRLKGHSACVFGTPLLPGNYQYLEKKQAQEQISEDLRKAILRLKNWYQQGANGSPP